MPTNLTPGAVQAVAEQAEQLIEKLQETLPLEDDLLAHDRRVAGIRKSVPTAAIQVAVSILEEIGDKGGGFDREAAQEALAFEVELGAVAIKLELLAARLRATISKRRSKAAATASGLFRSLEGQARSNGGMVPYVERLAPHLRRPRRNKKKEKPVTPVTPAAPSEKGA